ncbi:MAG: pyrroline-5-carboxylate reductase [Magnetococcales bacterium]|nr:pyrroline-5-carboxylate reductase [Magnetococcales bacterium]
MSTETIVTFLGGGNMAEAIIRGLVRDGTVASGNIRVGDPDEAQRRKYSDDEMLGGVMTGPDNSLLVRGARVVVVAVKPHLVEDVLTEIAEKLSSDAVVISIAAGITLNALRQALPHAQPVIRVMPNTPALVGEGISVLCPAQTVNEQQLKLAESLLSAVGEVADVTDEKLMDAVTALSGSGPAYVFLLAEAMSDGGVACGLPRPLADRLAIQTLLGASRLMDESGNHPAVLKSMVTSPGGTTVAGIAELEKLGVRGAMMSAIEAAWKRGKELGS